MEYKFAGNSYLAVNALEIGTSPLSLRASTRSRAIAVTVDGRKIYKGTASGVVIANGQFIGEADLVPRSHPGDGRLEVQIYALKPGERATMRRRLATGTHLPHPRITTASGARIRIEIVAGSWPIKADSELAGRAGRVEVRILSPAARLLL
jgi:diacylglycerol kinase family enzyme